MKKYEFLSAIEKELSDLPEKDVYSSLEYYSEMIDDRMEEGLSEEDAIREIGTPEEIAAQILSEKSLTKTEDENNEDNKINENKEDNESKKSKRKIKPWEIILLILGAPLWIPLVIAALSVALSLYVVIWSVLISLWAVGIALGVGGVALICSLLMYLFGGRFVEGMIVVGIAFILIGVSVFVIIGAYFSVKYTVILTKKAVLGIWSSLTKNGGK